MSNKQVKLTWSDGQSTVTDAATIERYRALYGSYPTTCKIEQLREKEQNK